MTSPFETKIEKLIYGGDGLAHHDQSTVFVPFVIPGELVRVTPVEAKKKFIRGTAEHIIEPSPDRIAEQCPRFTVCGGCHYQRNPLTFYSTGFTTCQDCHMPRAKVQLEDYGAKHGTLASHRWPAGNTAVPFYYGFDDQLQKTIEFLKSGNYLNVDLFGIEKAGEGAMTAPLGSAPFQLAPNEIVQMMVVIQNKNIGHSLVPEVRDLYEPWVEFVVQDAAGKEIYHSGFLKPDGSLDERADSFTNRPVKTDGSFVDNHKVWTIHSVAYDNSIQSGRSALVRYEFQIPAGVKGPLTVTARVNYRHLRQSYLNNVLGPDHPAYPVVELASRSRTLNIGDNPATPPDPRDNPDWMRWNNLGIAYLDQLQYADSMHAFEQVVKLRPDYADGHINIAL